MSDVRANAPAVDTALQASALTRKFSALTAVDQVTLTVNQGELFGLIAIDRYTFVTSCFRKPPSKYYFACRR